MVSAMRYLFLSMLWLCAANNCVAQSFDYYQKTALRSGFILEQPDLSNDKDQLLVVMQQAIASADSELSGMLALAEAQRNYNNTFLRFDEIESNILKVAYIHNLQSNTSTDTALRDVATDSVKLFDEWHTKLYFREDLYQLLSSITVLGQQLTQQQLRYREELLRDFTRNGFDLAPSKRQQVERLKLANNELSTQFSKNIRDYDKQISFSAAELQGVSPELLKGFNQNDSSSYKIDPRISSQYAIIMDNAQLPASREKMLRGRRQVGALTNPELLSNIILNRRDIAQLLGYQHYADYATEVKMSGDATTAVQFLQGLSTGLDSKFVTEVETLTRLKRDDPFANKQALQYWDVRYYQNQLRQKKYQLDLDQLRNYFPMEQVLSGLFETTEKLFSIEIKEAQVTNKWVDDLRLFVVIDKQTQVPMGAVYMDLYPREGKYSHFAHFSIKPGRKLLNGKRQRPVSALVCNFPAPSEDQPSLLSYSQVQTLFHEFGHAMHSMLSVTDFAAFHGTSVPRDFVEAPSQMLEFWLEEKSVLDTFAKDYRDPTKTIAADFLNKVKQAELATVGINERYQLALGLMDLQLHSITGQNRELNILGVEEQTFSRLYFSMQGSHMLPAFGHLAGGYAAGYYGYQWALAIASDLAAKFEAAPGGYADLRTGLALRQEIYAKGNSRPIDQSIRAFLGRDWTIDARLKRLGVNQKSQN